MTMIPKAKRDPSLFKNLRDIWLVPHGWKIVTACFSAEYKRVNAETQPHAAHGFRQLEERSAGEPGGQTADRGGGHTVSATGSDVL